MTQRKKKDKPPIKSIFVRICIFLFIAYAAVLLVDMQVSLAGQKQELNDLRILHEDQRLENKELERQLQQGADQEYIERIAREKLDYVAPDERVYIDISGS
ncbi:MAG: septum formation initiator family protein [Oscillospiraceae bacterium]|jgi:cell division protein FtsB|nr:septum formation initiator family protein [Oscillospiraceae bacterium]